MQHELWWVVPPLLALLIVGLLLVLESTSVGPLLYLLLRVWKGACKHNRVDHSGSFYGLPGLPMHAGLRCNKNWALLQARPPAVVVIDAHTDEAGRESSGVPRTNAAFGRL